LYNKQSASTTRIWVVDIGGTWNFAGIHFGGKTSRVSLLIFFAKTNPLTRYRDTVGFNGDVQRISIGYIPCPFSAIKNWNRFTPYVENMVMQYMELQ